MISAVIFAGGVGSRMKSEDIPKQFIEVEGKPIIIHTLEKFENHPQVDKIVVSCLESWIPILEWEIQKYNIQLDIYKRALEKLTGISVEKTL